MCAVVMLGRQDSLGGTQGPFGRDGAACIGKPTGNDMFLPIDALITPVVVHHFMSSPVHASELSPFPDYQAREARV